MLIKELFCLAVGVGMELPWLQVCHNEDRYNPLLLQSLPLYKKMFYKIYFMIEWLIGFLFSMMNIYQQV